MSALSSPFCSLFEFFVTFFLSCEHTNTFTPKSGLVRFVDFRIDDHGSFVISRSASVRPRHLFDHDFDHDYFFKLPCYRERDAQSQWRWSTAHHASTRAVPRANRTRTTANTHIHSATSNTSELPTDVPWPP